MAKTWEYNQGTWTAIDDPLAELNEPDFDKGMEQAGYAKEGIYGSDEDYLPQLELWGQQTKTTTTQRYPFLLWVSLFGDGANSVYLTDFPSVLMFLKEYAPVMQHQGHSELLRVLQSVAEKAFHVWHEHGLNDACRECDPDEVRLQERRQEAYRKWKAETDKLKAAARKEGIQ